MGFLSDLFKPKGHTTEPSKLSFGFTTELHSHLLPGIDDGVRTIEESLDVIRRFEQMGVKKIITTPHVMSDFYRNTPEIIHAKRDEVREVLLHNNIQVELETAAEYYMDEVFLERIKKKEPILTFGDNYVLVETGFTNETPFFNEVVFEMKNAGYQPVLAHPERYIYLYDDFEHFLSYYHTGVLFQINIGSLAGHYSKESKIVAEKLIEEKMVDFLGSDCHGMRHMGILRNAMQSPFYDKALKLNLLNYSL